MREKKEKVSEILKRYDTKKVKNLLISARMGSERAEGIYLPLCVYTQQTSHTRETPTKSDLLSVSVGQEA